MDRDRERLKEVKATDLTEGRLNEEFVDWLKTKGVTYLLFVMLGLVAYMAIVRWRGAQASYQAEAWNELTQAALPTSLQDVAEKYSDVGSVAELALLNAGYHLISSVQTGKTLAATAADQKDLTPDERREYLERADGFFKQVVDGDDASLGRALITATALQGRAVVAESLGKVEEAKQLYLKAAERTQASYPRLADQFRRRADNVIAGDTLPTFLTAAELGQRELAAEAEATSGVPARIEPWIRELIAPDEE